MQHRDKPSLSTRPRSSVVFPILLDAVVEKLHESSMPSRMKARITLDLAHVHEVEGRVFDAIIGYETAAFFFPRAQISSALRRLRRKLFPDA